MPAGGLVPYGNSMGPKRARGMRSLPGPGQRGPFISGPLGTERMGGRGFTSGSAGTYRTPGAELVPRGNAQVATRANASRALATRSKPAPISTPVTMGPTRGPMHGPPSPMYGPPKPMRVKKRKGRGLRNGAGLAEDAKVPSRFTKPLLFAAGAAAAVAVLSNRRGEGTSSGRQSMYRY